MSTQVRVWLPGVQGFRAWRRVRSVRQIFARSEHVFSRFRPDSELSRLNAAGGASRNASAELFAALERARGYWRLTDGWFDPTVGASLRALGYDRSFPPAGALDAADTDWRPVRPDGFGDVVLEPETRTVRLPSGTQLDFGGFIKGWTVDQAIKLLGSAACVDAGGDAAMAGDGPRGQGWCVDVEDPTHIGRSILQLRLRDQAVATSGANRRRWLCSSRELHHLIDPHTGLPADSALSQVTVVAPSAELADVLAKTIFLQGPAHARGLLKRCASASAVLVDRSGDVNKIGELFERELCP